MTDSDHIRPLDGVLVLDLSTFVTGGFATTMLANQGADVIKIERPYVGDDIRHSGPPFVATDDYDGPGRSAAAGGESPYFWTVNYGKRSVELNLKTEDGKIAFYELASKADVLLENFRPGTTDRLGIDYETIRSHNEAIVYCSISAFGEDGPWHDRPGYDLLIQGMSGIMSVTGEAEGPPAKVGVPMTDLITAMWAAFGVVNALYRRQHTGDGEHVELGMLDAAIPWLTKQAAKAMLGEEPTRMGTKDPVIAPYQSFPTADGFLNVACGNQRLWEGLCRALDREELTDDDRFETMADRVRNMDELEDELAETFTTRTTDDWVAELVDDHGLPVGPVYSVSDALTNEQTEARETIGSIDHPAIGEIPILEHPLNYRHAATGFDRHPPLLGEHTVEVLEELGYDEVKIEALRAANAIPEE